MNTFVRVFGERAYRSSVYPPPPLDLPKLSKTVSELLSYAQEVERKVVWWFEICFQAHLFVFVTCLWACFDFAPFPVWEAFFFGMAMLLISLKMQQFVVGLYILPYRIQFLGYCRVHPKLAEGLCRHHRALWLNLCYFFRLTEYSR